MTGFRDAVAFLTILPVGAHDVMLEADDLGRAAPWFPIVGLGIGAGLWIVEPLISPRLPPLAASGLLLTLWIVATGALHLDGFGDCWDGFFATATPDRRLEIMADSRSGAFAVVGVSLLLILKFTALSGVTEPIVLLLAPAMGRFWMLPLAMVNPARGHGLGARLHSALDWRRMLLPVLILAALAALAGRRAWLALLATGAATLALGLLAKSRIGGQTGDVLGANCELAEWIALLTYLWA